MMVRRWGAPRKEPALEIFGVFREKDELTRLSEEAHVDFLGFTELLHGIRRSAAATSREVAGCRR